MLSLFGGVSVNAGEIREFGFLNKVIHPHLRTLQMDAMQRFHCLGFGVFLLLFE